MVCLTVLKNAKIRFPPVELGELPVFCHGTPVFCTNLNAVDEQGFTENVKAVILRDPFEKIHPFFIIGS